jgi:putative tricarboxylic transport membrane protein
MRLTNHQLANLAILVVLLLFTSWYLWDTWRASTHIYNLIFVLPLTVIILLLCLVTFLKELFAAPSALDLPTERQGEDDETSTLPTVLLFVGYVLALPWLGFDVGTFLFVALFLRLAGEKKWPWALGYGLAFAFCSALFFSYMLPYPMPLLLLPGGN